MVVCDLVFQMKTLEGSERGFRSRPNPAALSLSLSHDASHLHETGERTQMLCESEQIAVTSANLVAFVCECARVCAIVRAAACSLRKIRVCVRLSDCRRLCCES